MRNQIKSFAVHVLALVVAIGGVKREALASIASSPTPVGDRCHLEGAMGNNPGASPAMTAEISAFYKGEADRINNVLAESLRALDSTGVASAAYRAGRAAALLKEIDGIVRRTKLRGVTVVSPAVEVAFTRGSKLAAEQAKELGLGGRVTQTETSFAGINERTVEALATDTAAKMAQRTAQHGDNAVSLFRSLSTSMAAIDADRKVRTFSLSEREVNRVIASGVISGDPRQALGAMRKLVGEGAGFDKATIENYRKVGNQLISVGDWTGTVRTYSEMVVRTRTAEAQRVGQIERQASVGLDLAQITGSNSANFCTRFVGLVVVVKGPARDGYMAISDLPGGGPPFHPNCTKNLAAFVEELVSEGRVTASIEAQQRYDKAAANGSLLSPVKDGRKAA